jgi:serine/threonine protein kinase
MLCLSMAIFAVLAESRMTGAQGFSATSWSPVGHLSQGSSSASVLYENSSFFVFGGCGVADCSVMLDDASIFDPVGGVSPPSLAPSFSSGFAGPHAVVAVSDSFYLVRSCSFYYGAKGASSEVISKYGQVTEVLSDLSTNESFLQIPPSHVRANASCVAVGNNIFIIGGFNLTSLAPMSTIDKLNVVESEYIANVASLGADLENPAVTTDGAIIYVAGGRALTLKGPSRTVYFIHVGAEPSQPCVGTSELPDSESLLGRDGVAMSVTAFGGFVVVANENRTVYAAADLRAGAVPSWTLFGTGGEAPQRSSWGAVPQTVGNRTELLFYRFGGFVAADSAAGTNVSVAATSIALPVPQLESTQVADGKLIFPLGGDNESIFCSDSANCQVRLSNEMQCDDDAAGTQPAQFVYPHRVAFVLSGQSSPVFVCFSFGVASALCPAAPAPFYPMNLQNPLSVVSQITPSPQKKSHGSEQSLLLYILGGVAAVTTAVAVLLVTRLKKVPDEGLLAGTTSSGVYGIAQQEERYRIISKIGEGTFSVVYLVHRRADGAKLALKHMECQSDLQRHEAIKECEIVRSLQGHPNVINLVDMFMNYEFDSARNDDAKTAAENLNNNLLEQDASGSKRSRHLCLVMQYHPAGDLRKWTLSQSTTAPIPEAILLSVAFQVCSVLKHCHAQDPPVIHRDLKPENILISNPSPHPTMLPIVVTDFGLARVQEGTHCASGAGTVPYVAPECFKKKYTVQCDLWSLGCVLYAVATRRVNNNTVRLMFQDVGNPDFHSSVRRDLEKLNYSELFIQFVLLLLEPRPTDRPTAVQAFRLFRKRKEEILLSDKAMAELKNGTTSVIPSLEERERHVPLPRNTSIEFTGHKLGPSSLNADSAEQAAATSTS